jgi:hypothetical protein
VKSDDPVQNSNDSIGGSQSDRDSGMRVAKGGKTLIELVRRRRLRARRFFPLKS